MGTGECDTVGRGRNDAAQRAALAVDFYLTCSLCRKRDEHTAAVEQRRPFALMAQSIDRGGNSHCRGEIARLADLFGKAEFPAWLAVVLALRQRLFPRGRQRCLA